MTQRKTQPATVNEAAATMLDHSAAINVRTQAQRELAESEVGIFFVYEGRLFIDGTPVSEAEPYGTFKGHANGHPAFWGFLQRNGAVPPDVEYDEVPRGRVNYDTKERKFHVFADACIIKDAKMIDRIEQKLNLSLADTAPPQLDSHYRCPGCMKCDKQREQEESDWDL